MMQYSEKLRLFREKYPCRTAIAGGASFRYILSGREDGKTLVFLNGGMNTLEMWMDYADALSADFRVLLFDYPQELRTNRTLVAGMHDFLRELGVERPVFVGASGGGMIAQIYVQRFPGETGGLVLISTGGMDEATLRSLKRQYRFAPLMLWYMKHCNYEKLKPTLIKAGLGHLRNETTEEAAYARDMFETIFRDYKREKDVHISGLLADLMVLFIGLHFVVLLAGKTLYPRWMLAFHPVTWNLLLAVIPDIAQAALVPPATWMSVMSQSSTNAAIVIWCIAAAVYGKSISKKTGSFN